MKRGARNENKAHHRRQRAVPLKLRLTLSDSRWSARSERTAAPWDKRPSTPKKQETNSCRVSTVETEAMDEAVLRQWSGSGGLCHPPPWSYRKMFA